TADARTPHPPHPRQEGRLVRQAYRRRRVLADEECVKSSEGASTAPSEASPQTGCAGKAGARNGTPTAHRQSQGARACYSDGLLGKARQVRVRRRTPGGAPSPRRRTGGRARSAHRVPRQTGARYVARNLAVCATAYALVVVCR